MNIRQVLEISSDFNELPRVRRFLHKFCNTYVGERFDEDHLAQMVLAVNEATVNIMEHAYHGEDGHPIQVVVHADDAQVAIELLHSGEAFTSESVAPPSFDGSRSNGFGVYLIANCMDDVQYLQNDQGQNCIYMIKLYPKHQSS